MDEGCWMEITEEKGDWMNQMFDGRIPMPGESCEIVCVEVEPHKVRFKLRVIAPR